LNKYHVTYLRHRDMIYHHEVALVADNSRHFLMSVAYYNFKNSCYKNSTVV